MPDQLVDIEGYYIVRQDRNVYGGGVALYIRNDFKYTKLKFSETEMPGSDTPGKPEYIICSVQKGDSEPILVAVIYRPPKIAFVQRTDLLDQIRAYSCDYSRRVIMGDLNAGLEGDGTESRFVKSLANELALQIVPHGVTNFTPTSSTWADVIMLDANDRVLGHSNEEPEWAKDKYHHYIDVQADMPIPKPTLHTFYYRNYKGIESNALLGLLEAADWSLFDATHIDVNIGLERLNANRLGAVEALAPLKKVVPKKKRPPWIDDELYRRMVKLSGLKRRYLRMKDPVLREEYHGLRELVNMQRDEAEKLFFQGKLLEALENNNIWKELRDLGLLPQKKSGLNGFSLEELNQHFAGVSISRDEDRSIMKDLIDTACEDGFVLKEVTEADIVLAVRHFSSQAVGEDGIPPSVIRKAMPIIGKFLVRLFNESLRSGAFPSLWRKARIIPIKKCPAPSTCSDFRPIAILGFLSKVMEKIVHTQISEHLEKNGILIPMQSGFRPYYSTQTALLKITEDIRMAKDGGEVTLLLQFDFSKAFDKVSPSILVERLIEMGFSRTALRWLGSYLSGREQLVCSRSDGNSSALGTNIGVPQGSVLGPLMFCLYANSLGEELQRAGVKYSCYADDLTVYASVNPDCLGEGVAELERAAVIVSDWAVRAKMKLNAEKTEACVFGSDTYVNKIISEDTPTVMVQVDGASIPLSGKVKILGVVLDSKFTWRPHADYIASKFNRVMYFLRHFRGYTTENLRRRLVTALLFPHLDYCSLVLLDTPQHVQRRLQVLQNTCVRNLFLAFEEMMR